jgi:hypothetical protein
MMAEYDVSFVRLYGVAAEKIITMPAGQRALLTLESEATEIDRERVQRYKKNVEEEIGEDIKNYHLEIKVINFEGIGKLGLVITRR